MYDIGRIVPIHRKIYSPTTTYEKLDIVEFDGSSYMALQNSTGKSPLDFPDYWGLLSRAGRDVIIDEEMNDLSGNAISNKVVKRYIDDQTVTKVSQLENDSKYITKSVEKLDNFYTINEADRRIQDLIPTNFGGHIIVEKLPTGEANDSINSGLIYFVKTENGISGWIFEEAYPEIKERYPKAIILEVSEENVEGIETELTRIGVQYYTPQLSNEEETNKIIIFKVDDAEKYAELEESELQLFKYLDDEIDLPFKISVVFIDEDDVNSYTDQLEQASFDGIRTSKNQESEEYTVEVDVNDLEKFANNYGIFEQYEYNMSVIESSIEAPQEGTWYKIIDEDALRQLIFDEISKVIAGAPESLDTLKEIADWIEGHASDAAAMNSAIKKNAEDIEALKKSSYTDEEIRETISEIYGELGETNISIALADYLKVDRDESDISNNILAIKGPELNSEIFYSDKIKEV